MGEQAYFMDLVDKRVQVSVQYVREYVEEYMAGHLESACHAVQEYGTRYVDTMSQALQAQRAGAPFVLCPLLSVAPLPVFAVGLNLTGFAQP